MSMTLLAFIPVTAALSAIDLRDGERAGHDLLHSFERWHTLLRKDRSADIDRRAPPLPKTISLPPSAATRLMAASR